MQFQAEHDTGGKLYKINPEDPIRTYYIDKLWDDFGCLPEDLPNATHDRNGWRERVMNTFR